MERDKKTEIVDNRIFETLKKLREEFKGEIQFDTNADYSKGTIRIKVKD